MKDQRLLYFKLIPNPTVLAFKDETSYWASVVGHFLGARWSEVFVAGENKEGTSILLSDGIIHLPAYTRDPSVHFFRFHVVITAASVFPDFDLRYILTMYLTHRCQDN